MHVKVADVINSLRLTGPHCIALWDVLVCPLGSRRFIPLIMISFGSGLNWRRVLGESWCRDGGIPQSCPLRKVFICAQL